MIVYPLQYAAHDGCLALAQRPAGPAVEHHELDTHLERLTAAALWSLRGSWTPASRAGLSRTGIA
jgi:hypothetical protein